MCPITKMVPVTKGLFRLAADEWPLTQYFCRWSSFVGRLAEDHFVGADEKFAVKTAGIKEFDPLRDGPLRYLGYSNECGWAPLHAVLQDTASYWPPVGKQP